MTIQELLNKLNKAIQEGFDPETSVKVLQINREELWDDYDLVREVFTDIELSDSLDLIVYSENHKMDGGSRSPENQTEEVNNHE